MSKNRICATATGSPKLTRRAFATAVCAAPLAALPVSAAAPASDYSRGYTDALKSIQATLNEIDVKKKQAQIHSEAQEVDNLIAIKNHTGLPLDDLSDWFCGLNSDVTATIADNIINIPAQTWNKQQTNAAIVGFRACEAFTKMDSPLVPYFKRQIDLRADPNEVDRIATIFRENRVDVSVRH